MTPEKQAEFRKLSETLIQWLNNNCHPPTTIIITPTTAELLEGTVGITTEEFVKD